MEANICNVLKTADDSMEVRGHFDLEKTNALHVYA